MGTYGVSGSFEGEEAFILNQEGKLSGLPSLALMEIRSERRRLVATHGSVAATPTGPFYPAHSPQALLLTILSVIDAPVVVGDPPVIPMQKDELD